MLLREITVPLGTDHQLIDSLLEDICRREGLGLALKTVQREYPGSLHWHWKRGKENGTLEVTHWPPENRLWIYVHENRAAPWTDSMAARLASQIEEKLHSEAVDTIFAEFA